MALKNRITKNGYLFFTFKLIRLLFIVFLLDFSIGNALRHFYFKQTAGRQYRATYTIDKTTTDVLIFGSSRAYSNYVPDVFEDRLKLSCYNTGSPGQFILYDYATLKAVLKRYSPKLIILDLISAELGDESKSTDRTYERLSFLLPYYKEHREMRPVLDLKGPFEKFKLASSIYPFNSSLIYIAASRTEYFKKRNMTIKGYNPRQGVWNKPIATTIPQPYPLDCIKLNIYKSFIEDCRKAGTKIFVVCSPMYIKVKGIDYSTSIAKSIAAEQNVVFMDFTNDSFFASRPELFADDPLHLNPNGAEIFSNRLIDMISDSLQHY